MGFDVIDYIHFNFLMLWRDGQSMLSNIRVGTQHIAKVFDKVAHQRLLKKISSYGIKGIVLSWISSFLSDRREWVSVKVAHLLGPILFIIYVNDIPDIVKSSVLIFAHNTKIFAITDQADTLQEDLNNVSTQETSWRCDTNIQTS